MKYKVVIVCVTLALVLALGIGELFYVQNTFETLAEKLQNLQEADGSFDITKAEEIYSWWQGKHEWLELTLPHAQLNDIEYNFGEMLGGIRAEDYMSAEAMLTRIVTSANALKEMNSVDAGNVF